MLRAFGACLLDLIQQYTMIEHFELAQESRSSLMEAVSITHDARVTEAELITHDGCVTKVELLIAHDNCVIGIRKPHDSEFLVVADCNKFIRLSDESFPDLEGPKLAALRAVCLDVHRSEEFFLNFNLTDQWVRTVIAHEELCPQNWFEIEDCRKLIPDRFSIHSNVLPYEPYWSEINEVIVRDEASMRVHFPSSMLNEALAERKSLKTKLLEWKNIGEGCDIRKDGLERPEDGNCERQGGSKLFWKIPPADVKYVKDLVGGNSSADVWLITWRGGKFVRKGLKSEDHAEVGVLKKLCHSQIIYCFGETWDVQKSAYLMEYIPDDLFNFIRNKVNRDNGPPFSHHNSVDVLLQVAKAIRYLHQENVVHCDLKCDNILVSKIVISQNVKHYLVKIADFGSARSEDSSSGSGGYFIAGPGTTTHSAPEALEQRRDMSKIIKDPQKIDVYSFGIVAFEVLTGKDNLQHWKHSPRKFKEGVIKGNLRPPLRVECRKDKELLQNEKLIFLIERCWENDPSERLLL